MTMTDIFKIDFPKNIIIRDDKDNDIVYIFNKKTQQILILKGDSKSLFFILYNGNGIINDKYLNSVANNIFEIYPNIVENMDQIKQNILFFIKTLASRGIINSLV